MYLRCPGLPSKTEPVIWKLEGETGQLTQFSDLKGKVSSCAKILKQVEGKSRVSTALVWQTLVRTRYRT